MAKKQNFLSKYRVLLPIIVYKYIHIVYKHKYVCIYDSYQQIGIDMYAQKNGPYAVHIGQRPVNSPISPLFCQARRTCPELGAFRTHHSVLGNLSLMGNALCIYLLCVDWWQSVHPFQILYSQCPSLCPCGHLIGHQEIREFI